MTGERSVFYVNLLAIAIGRALGSVARHLFATFVYRLTPPIFPSAPPRPALRYTYVLT
jgi:hypothetical protein